MFIVESMFQVHTCTRHFYSTFPGTLCEPLPNIDPTVKMIPTASSRTRTNQLLVPHSIQHVHFIFLNCFCRILHFWKRFARALPSSFESLLTSFFGLPFQLEPSSLGCSILFFTQLSSSFSV